MKRTLLLITVLMLSSPVFAATYYIDGKIDDDCDGTNFYYNPATRTCNAGEGQIAWRHFSSANSELTAGDTVYIRGGTYTVGNFNSVTEGIQPRNSGESEHPITYTVFEDEVVNMVGQADDGDTYSVGIWINGKSHIKVDGKSLGQLNLSKMSAGLLIGPNSGNPAVGDSSYNEVCHIHVNNSYFLQSWRHSYQGSAVWQRAFYNHVHHCKFEKHGYVGTEEDGGLDNEGNLFELGDTAANEPSEETYFNVIENNEFLHAGHATFGFFGKQNVVRNNYFHNEGYYDIDGVLYGYRNIISHGVSGHIGYNLFEGNRIGHAAPNYTYEGKTAHWGGTGMKLCHPFNIIRYNSWFNNASEGLTLASYSGIYTAKADHNYFYNNTFFRNGFYTKLPGSDSMTCSPIIIGWTDSTDYRVSYGSAFINNLYYDNATSSNDYGPFKITSSDWPEDSWAKFINPDQGNVTVRNNFNGESGQDTDPEFVDTTLTSHDSHTLPNLNLQATSPAVDAGTNLTLADGSGANTTTLIVDEAQFFQDGNFGEGPLAWPSSAEIHADWIAIGTYENTVQIHSINYGTNTITLASQMTWQDNAPIWLYKKSDGVQVLYDEGPDMGAHEYGVENDSPNQDDPSPSTTGSSNSSGGGCFMKTLFW